MISVDELVNRANDMSIKQPCQTTKPRHGLCMRLPCVRLRGFVLRAVGSRTVRFVVLCCLVLQLTTAHAGEVELTNGFTIQGTPFRISGLNNKVARATGATNSYPVWAVEDGFRRYFISRSMVKGGRGSIVGTAPNQQYVPPSGVKMDADLSRYEKFDLPQQRKNRRTTPSVIGSMTVDSDFNEHGRRIVNLAGVKFPVIQGVTRITPQYVKIEGLNLQWECGLATTSIPPNTLHSMIENAIDTTDPTDRLAVINFYIEAQMYDKAATELSSLLVDHPDLADFKPVENNLRQQQARVLLAELRRRQRAGQHQLAMKAARQFPLKDLAAEALRDVRDLLEEYDEKRDFVDTVHSRLGDLQSELPKGQLQNRVVAIRGELRAQIDFNSIDRLTPFMNLEGLTAEEQLALAISGWLLGSADAITDLKQALNLWDARFLILEIVRTKEETTRQELTRDLEKLEGVGHAQILKLIPRLPPLIESAGVKVGQTLTIELAARDGQKPTAYSVVLPPEYSVNHVYPTIVTLRPQGRSIENQLSFWAGTAQQPGQAQRHGYIVIAPHYIDEQHPKYEHDARAHQVVIDAIVDARKRFQIDSDRVFLTGHGMGADAAIDLGMARPHEFAGVLPIIGTFSPISNWYFENSVDLGWYFVTGELARSSLEYNASYLDKMMGRRLDVVCVEYIGRGYEHYYEEIHRMFEWMSFQKRDAWPSEINATIKRPRDNRFYWLQAYGLPAALVQPSIKPKSMPFKARVSNGNTLKITSGAAYHDVYLSPDIVDFDRDLTVIKGGRRKFSGGIKPSISDTLDGLRETGDRQQLRWQRLRIN